MALVEYEVRGRIATITMNRPEKLNAMNREMLEGLWEAFTNLRDDPEVWLGIVTGTGRAFSVGHDLEEMGGGGKTSAGSTDELYFMVQHIWKPIIAAVNGYCLAQGAGIALGADIRVAAETAQFGWPQTKRGISSISGPVILGHRVPLGQALELLLTGDFLPGLRGPVARAGQLRGAGGRGAAESRGAGRQDTAERAAGRAGDEGGDGAGSAPVASRPLERGDDDLRAGRRDRGRARRAGGLPGEATAAVAGAVGGVGLTPGPSPPCGEGSRADLPPSPLPGREGEWWGRG